jgi:predicted dehydrogenase
VAAAQKELRFGIIGLGLMGREFASVIGRWHHLLDIGVKPRIAGICDTNPALHGWFQDSVPNLKVVTTDYKDLLSDPSIDAIYCAVPHSLHQQLYIDIINAGKHLLGEKPFGIDAAANEAIQKAIDANPKVLVRCCSEFPYFPGAQRVIQAAQQDRFGQILEVNSGFLHSSDMDFNKPLNWKRDVKVNGEYGCMGDLGMHALHAPLRLGWFPKRLSAVLSNVVKKRPDGKGGMLPCHTWDNAQIQCEVEAKGQAFPMTIKTQRIAPGETDTWYLEVRGTKFSAAFSTKFPKTLRSMEYVNGGEQAWKHEDLGYKSAYKTITGEIFEFGFTDALLQMWASFCDELGGRSFKDLPFGCATPQEARQSHALLTAALQSYGQKKTVELGSAA